MISGALDGRPNGASVGSQGQRRIKDAAAPCDVLRSTGRLNSLDVVTRPDQTETRVEFLTIRDGDGPGRNVTYLRAID